MGKWFMKKMIRSAFEGMILALQFFTTVPVKRKVDWNQRNGQAFLCSFPFIGLLLGCILYMIGHFTVNVMPVPVFIFFLMFLSVLYSGALHLDGFMDVCDAVLSHRTREKKLLIMKDPQVGPFAVVSFFFLMGWRFLFMYETFRLSAPFFLYLFFIPFLTRWIMGLMILYARPARNEGIAFAFQAYRTGYVKAIYVLWPVFLTAACFLFLPGFAKNWFLLCTAALIFYLLSIAFYYRQFGGVTGDTIGAAGEGGETVLWMIAFLLHCFATA